MEPSKNVRVLKPHGNHFIPYRVSLVRYPTKMDFFIGFQRHSSQPRLDISDPKSDIYDQSDLSGLLRVLEQW
jgi:hypothetical protein